MARKQDERERFWSTVDTSNADGVIAKRNELFTHNDADRSSDLISAPAGLVA